LFTNADIGHLKVKGVFVLGCYDLKLNLLSKFVVNSQYQISLYLSSMKQEGVFSHALVSLCGIGRISAT
jgi:hypothetical protein